MWSPRAAGRLALRLVIPLAVAAVSIGCGSRSGKGAASPPSCRDDAGDDVETAARTGVAGAKTGAKTAVSGVKTFGSATVGLVEGGGDEAKARWKEGSSQTKETARTGGAETKKQADVPRCH